MSEPPTIVVSASVLTDDQQAAAKVWDVLGRIALGLALDGVSVNINISTVDDVTVDEEEETG